MNEKKKRLAWAIETVWKSLETHLPETYDPTYPKLKHKLCKENMGTKDFHRKCVKDYSKVIQILSEYI